MYAVLSSPSMSSSSQTLVDTEAIMATLNVGSLRISYSAQKEPGETTPLTGRGRGEWHRRESELLSEELQSQGVGEVGPGPVGLYGPFQLSRIS